MRFNFAELVDSLRGDTETVVRLHEKWNDTDLDQLWQERAAIMEYDGGLSREDADELSKQWLISVVGADRFARIDWDARSAHAARLHT